MCLFYFIFHICSYAGLFLMSLGLALCLPVFIFLENFSCMTNCFELMLYQNDKEPFSNLNYNIHNLTKLFNIIGDYSIGIRTIIKITFIFIIILHFFDIYDIKDFTLVDPYFVTATICNFVLIYAINISTMFTSGWFTEKIQLLLRNPLHFRTPNENRNDMDEVEREQERENFLTDGIGAITVPREIQYFEIGSFANATVLRALWYSLLSLVLPLVLTV